MKVITAVERLAVKSCPKPYVFLAGGITNCWEWQDKTIELLSKTNLDFTLMNPRRKNFPINDPNASKDQITWEFQMLERMHIFSMYYCKGDSDQPICMYELGRHLNRYENEEIDGIIISVEDGYRRKEDVYIQTELVDKRLGKNIGTNVEQHAAMIEAAVEGWKENEGV